MHTTPSGDPTPTRPRSPRWWPLIVLLLAEATWLAWVWTSPAVQRQQQVMKTGGSLLVVFLLYFIWLLAFSRLRWKARIAGLLLPVIAIALFAAAFRVDGVTGDLVPIITPRWKATAAVPSKSAPEGKAGAPSADQRLPENFAGFPQFLGPTRDGIIPGPALATDWNANPPALLWRVPVGGGYSGHAIAGSRVLGLEQTGGDEVVVCRDLFSGATLWSHADPARFENSVGGIGPRTTPAVAGERVFVVGATGHLRALDLTTGRPLWQRDMLADAGAAVPDWGVSGSPLVLGDLVIVHPGGAGASLIAYRAKTGEPAWKGGDARAAYGSPQLVTLAGEPQILIFNHEGVTAHAPADGRPLWTYPWTKAAQHVSDPRVVGPNRFVVSSGYGGGADLVEVSRGAERPDGVQAVANTGATIASPAWSTSRVWHSRRLKSKFGSLVVRDGFLYGLDDGRLTCIDVATGEPRWKGERVGHGQVLLCGDHLLVTAENGEVLLQQATPEAARELTRFTALSGKMWNPPALGSPYLVVRTETEAACYRLPLADSK